jgi:hypothetical protein
MLSPLTKYKQSDSKSYGNRNGTPLDPSRCHAKVTHDNGRAPATYSQCRYAIKTTRPADDGDWSKPNKVEVEIPVCGKHSAYYDKEMRKAKEYKEKEAEKNRVEREAQNKCDELLKLGIKAEPYYHSSYAGGDGYTGEVVVDPDALLELLKKSCDRCGFLDEVKQSS